MGLMVIETLQQTRIFDKKKYHFYAEGDSYNDTNELADELYNRGYRVRRTITPSTGATKVWIRKK